MKPTAHRAIATLAILTCAASQAFAAITMQDDAGNTVTLPKPAQRIVTLAPHVTELVFAAGAGERIVGTVSYSDFPPAARSIPLVGDNRQVDIERLVSLKPDLLIVWRHNSADKQLDTLRRLGIPLFYNEPHTLDDIPQTIERFGRLFGTEDKAVRAAAELRRKLADLAARYSVRPKVRVFYQVWDKPLYTLNGRHIVNDVIHLCGGENIFASLTTLAPSVTVEAVLLENPEAIISGQSPEKPHTGLDTWKQYTALQAVKRDNLFAIDGNLLNRAGPRMIDGAAAICEKLDLARQHRKPPASMKPDLPSKINSLPRPEPKEHP
jgi:iron complex transport system substrate-binding protein